MKACVFVPNWVGDVVMATPALRALRKSLGTGAVMIGIMKSYVVDVLKGTPWFDDIWLYDRESDDPERLPFSLLKRLRAARIDLSVHLTNDFLSAFVAWAGGVKKRAGYVRYKRGAFLNVKLHPLRARGEYVPSSTLDYYLKIATALGCPEEPPLMELATNKDDERAADHVWEKWGLRPADRVVVFNSSGAYGAAKIWPDAHFAGLGRRIADEEDLDVLILCGPAERERAERIVRTAEHPRIFSLAHEELSLGLSKACVRRSRLMVTTDSGPRHFAAAFNVPSVVLFGPTHIAWSDTHQASETKLQIPMDCGPCQRRTCPLGHHKCMRDLDVNTVFQAVRSRLREGLPHR
jgi:heptosyltransferase-2